MKKILRGVIAISVSMLAANSWGYPIYPSPFDRNAAHDRDAAHQSMSARSGRYLAADEVLAERSAGAGTHLFSANHALNRDETFSVYTSSGVSWRYAAPGSIFNGGGFGFPVRAASIAATDDADTDEHRLHLRFIEELKSRTRFGEGPSWVGLNLRDLIVEGADKAKPGKGDGNGKSDGEHSSNNGVQVSVSEPGSIALICSGMLGLMLTRRLCKAER